VWVVVVGIAFLSAAVEGVCAGAQAQLRRRTACSLHPFSLKKPPPPPPKKQKSKTVDRFNNLYVSALVTPGGGRLLLLHDGRGDDAVRAFLTDAYELYLRVSGFEVEVEVE
jgi:hypothetical protein